MGPSEIKLLAQNFNDRTPYAINTHGFTFPGGEPHCAPNLHSHDMYAKFVIDARVSNFNGMGGILVLKDFLDRNPRTRDVPVHLYIPYLPGARQDRGEPLTAKVYADLINSAEFASVTSVDVHSDVAPALLNNFVHVPLARVFPDRIFPDRTEAVLVCPDAGARKRVEELAKATGHKVVYAEKTRNFKTGELTGFHCQPIPEGMHAIVVDDICDGGGTFLGLATVMWDTFGNDIPQTHKHLWTTHGIYSKGLDALNEKFTTVACTDSFPVSHGGTRSYFPDYKTTSDVIMVEVNP